MAIRQLMQDSRIFAVRSRSMQARRLRYMHLQEGSHSCVQESFGQSRRSADTKHAIGTANRENHQDCKPRRSVCSVVLQVQSS